MIPSWLDQEKLSKLRSETEPRVILALTPKEAVILNGLMILGREKHDEPDSFLDGEEHEAWHELENKWNVVIHENDCCVDKECNYAR